MEKFPGESYSYDDYDDFEEEPKIEKKKFAKESYSPEDYEEKVGYLESAAHGAGQIPFGFGEEIAAGAKSLYDVTAGDYKLKDLLDRYSKNVKESRKRKDLAYEQHPYIANAIEVAGGLLPIVGLSKYFKGSQLAKATKGGAASGLLTGYGKSRGDSVEGQLVDSLLGGALGASLGNISSRIGQKLLGRTKDEITKKLSGEPKLALSDRFKGEINEDVKEAFIKSPEKFKKFSGIRPSQIVQEAEETLNPEITRKLLESSKEATNILKKSGVKFSGKKVSKIYDDLIKQINDKFNGQIDINDEAYQAIQYLKQKSGFWKSKNNISPERIKEEIKSLNLSGIYSKDPNTIKRLNAANKAGVAGELRKLLKDNIPKYEKHMEEETRILGKLKGLTDDKANTYNKIRLMLDRASSGKETISPKDVEFLNKLGKSTKRDWIDDYSYSLLNKKLDESVEKGGKSLTDSQLGSTIINLLGAGVGSSVGGLPGTIAGLGVATGANAIGKAMKKGVAKFGKEEAIKALEKAVKMREKINASDVGLLRKQLSDAQKEALRAGGSSMLTYELLRAFFEKTKKDK